MIPPLLRRCPRCGFVGLTAQFSVVDGDHRRRVECPSCHTLFDPTDQAWLA